MSVVLVTFPGAPKVSEEAQKKDAEIDKRLEVLINGIFIEKLEMKAIFVT